MKQNDHLSYTILDAEYQVLDAEQPVNRGVRRGILITALILVALGLVRTDISRGDRHRTCLFHHRRPVSVRLIPEPALFPGFERDAQRLDLS